MNTVLIDADRINALHEGYGRVTIEHYDEICTSCFRAGTAYKFLVIGDTLVIGPTDDHKYLYLAFITRELTLEEAKKAARRVSSAKAWEKNAVADGPIIAAGIIDVMGKVDKWFSVGFDVETPEPMRDGIARQIAEMVKKGILETSGSLDEKSRIAYSAKFGEPP